MEFLASKTHALRIEIFDHFRRRRACGDMHDGLILPGERDGLHGIREMIGRIVADGQVRPAGDHFLDNRQIH